jgi:hypothetical protein
VKMDKFHLFEQVFKFCFMDKRQWVMKFTNNIFFSYIYVCVDIVVHFVMGLVTMIHHKKYTCVPIIQFLHLCAFHT